MSTNDGAMRQPPNPADLQRHPPKDARCAHFRGLMRDYADCELPADQAATLEQHVHECRVCAVALARAEHELLRLRRSLLQPLPTVPHGFARLTVQRLVRDLEQSPEFDLAPVIEPVAVKAAGKRPVSMSARLTVWLSAMAAAMLLVAGLVWQTLVQDEPQCRLEATYAGDTLQESPGVRKVSAGDSFGNEVLLRTYGVAGYTWRGGAAVGQQGAKLQVSNASYHLVDDKFFLASGEVDVDSPDLRVIRLADGSQFEVRGRAHLDLSLSRGHHDALNPGADLLGYVEMVSGDVGRLTRADKSVVDVPVGKAVLWRSGSATVEVAVDPQWIANNLHGRPRSAVPVLPAAQPLGRVLDDAKRAVVGASIKISYVNAAGDVRVETMTSAADGTFNYERIKDSIARDFLVVEVLPSASDFRLGYMPPTAMARPVEGLELVLPTSPALYGMVTTAAGAGIDNVQVVPTLIDDLTGQVCQLPELSVTSTNGSFRLTRLPVTMEPFVRLGVSLLHREYASRWVGLPPVDPQVGTPSWSLAPLRECELHVETESSNSPVAPVELYEGLAGLPSGTAVRRYPELANHGHIDIGRFRWGGGPLWLRESSGYRQLTSRGREFDRGNLITGAVAEMLDQLRDQQPRDTPFLLGRTHRNQQIEMAMGSVPIELIDATNQPLPTRIYVQASGGTRFHLAGVTSTAARGALRVLASWNVVAVRSDGSTGFSFGDNQPNQVLAYGEARQIEMQAPGGVVLAPSLLRSLPTTEMVELQFASRDNRWPQLVLHGVACSPSWTVDGLPPGRYNVTRVNGRALAQPLIEIRAGESLPLR